MQRRQASRRRVVIIASIVALALSAVPCVSAAPEVTVPLAGGKVRLHYAGDRLDGGAVRQSTWHGWTFAERHTYLPDRKLLLLGTGRTREVPSVTRTSGGKQTLLVGADDKREVYELDQSGRQLRTLDSVTGAALLTFGYDARGRLGTVDAAAGHKVVLGYGPDGCSRSATPTVGTGSSTTPGTTGGSPRRPTRPRASPATSTTAAR